MNGDASVAWDSSDSASIAKETTGVLTDKSHKCLIIIPCYNEETSIRSVIAEAKACGSEYETLVVDDCSDDGTSEQASNADYYIRHIINLGVGGAVQTGIKFALRNGYRYCVQVDGDAQHPPSEVRVLLKRIKQGDYDLVIGSRFLKRDSYRSTFARRIGIAVIRIALRALYGVRITDPTSGFRIINRRAMRLFAKEYPYDYPEPTSIALALQSGLRISEVGITMRDRKGGSSKFVGIHTIRYMIRVIGYLFLIKLTARHN